MPLGALDADDGRYLAHRLAAAALLEGFARDAARIGAEVVEAAASGLATHMGTGARAR